LRRKIEMKDSRSIITVNIFVILSVFFILGDAGAQIPDVSSPSKEGCFDQSGKLINCGESFTATLNGVVYDCTCNCSGEDTCTPRTQSNESSGSGRARTRSGRIGGSDSSQESDNSAAVAAENEKLKKKQEALEKAQQKAFEQEKENLVGSLKGSDADTPVVKAGNSAGLALKAGSSGSSLGLKSGNSHVQTTATEGQPMTADIAGLSTELSAIKEKVPPPLEDVSLTCNKISDNNDEGLLKKADILMFAWDVAGTMGSKVMPWGKAIFIGYKTVLAGADQADLYLIKQDEVFNRANRYLKDPVTAREFAELVRSIKANSSIPASTDPEMLIAARAVSDPKINSVSGIFWDAMLSPEAKAAMVKKAMIESGTEFLGAGLGGMLSDVSKRKELFEAARIARNKALNNLKYATDAKQKAEIQAIIKKDNEILDQIYRFKEGASNLLATFESSEAGEAAESWKGEDRQ
jgi:hypothetical protein